MLRDVLLVLDEFVADGLLGVRGLGTELRHEFSASSISAITARLDEQLEQFSRRSWDQEFPYVVLDARYARVRESGVIVSRAVLIALGIDWEG
jgi:transposase-like protein